MNKSDNYKIYKSIQDVVTKYGITQINIDVVLNKTKGGTIALNIEYDS